MLTLQSLMWQDDESAVDVDISSEEVDDPANEEVPFLLICI